MACHTIDTFISLLFETERKEGPTTELCETELQVNSQAKLNLAGIRAKT